MTSNQNHGIRGITLSGEHVVLKAEDYDRLMQCHREGWQHAQEVEDEYRKRTGHGFGVAHETPACNCRPKPVEHAEWCESVRAARRSEKATTEPFPRCCCGKHVFDFPDAIKIEDATSIHYRDRPCHQRESVKTSEPCPFEETSLGPCPHHDVKVPRSWEFNRFHNGKLMAQGAVVTAVTEQEAREKARSLFYEPEYRLDTFELRAAVPRNEP